MTDVLFKMGAVMEPTPIYEIWEMLKEYSEHYSKYLPGQNSASITVIIKIDDELLSTDVKTIPFDLKTFRR